MYGHVTYVKILSRLEKKHFFGFWPPKEGDDDFRLALLQSAKQEEVNCRET